MDAQYHRWSGQGFLFSWLSVSIRHIYLLMNCSDLSFELNGLSPKTYPFNPHYSRWKRFMSSCTWFMNTWISFTKIDRFLTFLSIFTNFNPCCRFSGTGSPYLYSSRVLPEVHLNFIWPSAFLCGLADFPPYLAIDWNFLHVNLLYQIFSHKLNW